MSWLARQPLDVQARVRSHAAHRFTLLKVDHPVRKEVELRACCFEEMLTRATVRDGHKQSPQRTSLGACARVPLETPFPANRSPDTHDQRVHTFARRSSMRPRRRFLHLPGLSRASVPWIPPGKHVVWGVLPSRTVHRTRASSAPSRFEQSRAIDPDNHLPLRRLAAPLAARKFIAPGHAKAPKRARSADGRRPSRQRCGSSPADIAEAGAATTSGALERPGPGGHASSVAPLGAGARRGVGTFISKPKQPRHAIAVGDDGAAHETRKKDHNDTTSLHAANGKAQRPRRRTRSVGVRSAHEVSDLVRGISSLLDAVPEPNLLALAADV
mmetsp:Transcript_13134/g.38612  ORF Transcript_13134/g.38612 Transcript_13134/m.38612 type:complete len:328 (-) Transcript_13134:167-1150(-)